MFLKNSKPLCYLWNHVLHDCSVFTNSTFFYIKEEVLFESSLVRNHRALTSRHLLVQVFEQISQIVLVFLLLTLNK